jgi:predicted nicotinamide N-methyase
MSEIFDSIVHGNAATPDAEIDAQPTAEHDDVESDSEHCEEEHEHEHDQVSGTACVHWHAFPVDSNQTASIATAGSISSVPVQRAAVQIRPVSSRPSATAHQQPAAPAASTPDRIWVAEEVGGAVGGRVWDAALYAREYLQRILAKAPGFFDGKRILDLGSGTGVLGIWLYAWLCRQRPRSRTTVVVSDQAELMPLLERNVRFNQLIHQSTAEDAPRIEAHEYSWGESVEHLGGTFDFVIASDTLYQPALFPVLFSALTDTTHATSTILLSYRRRGVDEHHQELFFDRLVDHSLTARPANNADGIGDGNCHFFVVSRIKNE